MNKVYTGTCVNYSSEGHGIIKSIDGVIFVYGLFLGEEAKVELTFKRSGVMYGKVVQLLKKSPYRIQPLCKVCTACGGCQFHQIDYQEELRIKRNNVIDTLRMIGGISFEVKPTIGMDEPYYYRNKIQMPVGFDKKKNIVSGFYKAKSHEIIPIDECVIEDKRAIPIIKRIKELMKSMRIDPYDEDKRTGIIRHILIRTSHYYDEVMVTLVTNVDSFPSRNNFVKELTKSCHITTVVQNINKRDTNVILGEQERVLYGKGFIKDKLNGIDFNISSKSFYQTNYIQTEKLYNKAIELANLKKTDVVFDAYSGIGTIGLIASKHVKNVISVELEKEAFKNALNNAKNNNIRNFVPYNDDATKFILEYVKDKKNKVDVLFMDPPRKGSTPEFLNAIKQLSPSRVIYISCNPATLARDLKDLLDKYEIKEIVPVDLFPRTFHVETLACLQLKER